MSRRNHKPSASNISPNLNVPHDEIAREAFKLYQGRHGAPGDPVADWFEATRIVTSRTTTPKASPRAASAEAAAGNARGRNNNSRSRTTPRRRGRK